MNAQSNSGDDDDDDDDDDQSFGCHKKPLEVQFDVPAGGQRARAAAASGEGLVGTCHDEAGFFQQARI